MIKASALLVALAIGLLVAGVVGSSLLMVYVSIGVCAVAALLLAVGVLLHWSEIFGRREARPASTQGAWSEPQVNVTAPVLASIQAVAAERAHRHSRREEAGVRPARARSAGTQSAGTQSAGARSAGARSGGGRAPERPAKVVPSPAEAAVRGDEVPAAGRGDDLWERVEEELGSAAKRDTGALSWPATVFPPISPDGPVPAEPAAPAPQAGPQGEPRVEASAWIWGSGAGWQPPETADPAWPPPAAAFAEPQVAAKPTAPKPPAPKPPAPKPPAPEPGAQKPAAPEPAAPEPGGPGDRAGPPVPDEAAAEPAAGAGVAQDTDVAEDTEPAADVAAPQDTDVAEDAEAASDDDAAPDDGVVLDDDAVLDDEAASDAEDHEAADHEVVEPARESTPGEPAAGANGPQWIIAASRPADQEPAAGTPAAQSPAAQESAAEESAAEESAAKGSAAQESAAQAPDADNPAAGDSSQQPAAKEPATDAPGAPESAAEEPAGDGAAKPAPGRVEVTVVPGVARYHRSGCILIRFLSAGDLETMTRREAEDAKMMACRACQPDQLED